MNRSGIKRNRTAYVISIVVVIALGIASRKIMGFPYFVYEYVGDTLWALNVYLIFVTLFPSEKVGLAAVITFFFAFLIEFSQIYHAPWIDDIRNTFLGGLVLGYGFLWSDILCYLIGTFLGVTIDLIYLKFFHKKE